MNPETEKFLTTEAFWSLLEKPLPEMPPIVRHLASLCADEYAEAHLDGVGRSLERMNTICQELFARRIGFAARLDRVRMSCPLAVLVACMRACPIDGADPKAEEEAWRMAWTTLASSLETLSSVVLTYEMRALLRGDGK